ncbi:hypothetical protein C8R45DRAFT_1075837 [Mycena sanguinolenta]|nr:hypothetical protein C8R45DRAFT_1075837 [Mycena sanguinolenta]
MNKVVKDCHAELDEAKKIFQVSVGGAIFKDIGGMKKATETKHKELLELISAMSETSTMTDSSSAHLGGTGLKNSRVGSYHEMFSQEAPRVAILGGGGMGKTVLREQSFTILTLLPSLNKDSFLGTHSVSECSRRISCPPLDVQHLGLIVTMRGAERPAKVRWTHPFLLPLQPLSDDAAQQTFMDITDGSHSVEDFRSFLALQTICHWLWIFLPTWLTLKAWNMSWLDGKQRKHPCYLWDMTESQIWMSINLSLSCPRITSESKELLSLLSILPNGLSDAELVQSKLPIANILSCKATLLATSLAYQNSNKRLMADAYKRCFYALLKLYWEYSDGQLRSVVNQITLNLGNLQEVLQEGLHAGDPNLADTIYCSISLTSFYRLTGRGVPPLMDHIQHMLPGISNLRLEIHFIIEALKWPKYSQQTLQMQMKKWIVQGISHFEQINDPLLESKFYDAAAIFTNFISDIPASLEFITKAKKLSSLSGDHTQEYRTLYSLANHKIACGHYAMALEYARESQERSELSMDLYHSASALKVQAQCFTLLGNYQKSMIQLHKARKLLDICGMSRGLVDRYIAHDQAEIHLLKSEYTQAQRIFSDTAEILEENNGAYDDALLNLAYIDIQIGGAAANVWENLNVVAGRHKGGSADYVLDLCKLIEAQLNLREQEFDLAQRKFQECLRSRAESTSPVLEQLADIKAWPACKEHSKWSIIYLSFACTVKEKLAFYKALLFMGDVFIINADEDTAFSLYTVALEGFTYMDVHRSRAQCMLHLGDLAHKHGNTVEAIAHWKTARPLFEKSSQAKDVAQIDSRLASVETRHEEVLTTLAKLQDRDATDSMLVRFVSKYNLAPPQMLVHGPFE